MSKYTNFFTIEESFKSTTMYDLFSHKSKEGNKLWLNIFINWSGPWVIFSLEFRGFFAWYRFCVHRLDTICYSTLESYTRTIAWLRIFPIFALEIDIVFQYADLIFFLYSGIQHKTFYSQLITSIWCTQILWPMASNWCHDINIKKIGIKQKKRSNYTA